MARWTFGLSIALLGLSPGVAPAVDDAYQASEYTLDQTRPGRVTAEHFKFDYVNPENPDAKPPAVKQVVTILPKGARYDASAPGSCTASDAELTLQGGAACPPESRIGGGVITVDTGVPGPGRFVTADTEFFNNATDPEGEFVYVNTVRGTGARTVLRADVTKRTTVTEAPILPGTPPDGGAIDTVDLEVSRVVRTVDGIRRAYITTPSRCPRSRTWTTRVRFTYGDDYSQTVPTANSCLRRGD